MTDAWYLNAAEYYVELGEDAAFPVRQGDVFGPHADLTDWRGFIVTHPSCELQTKKAPRIQVARLRAVSELGDDFEKAAITFGFSQGDDGDVRVAFSHTFWLPPATEEGGNLSEPMFADFRDVSTVPPEAVHQDARTRALTHDARVSLIRRMLHFRFRWNIPFEQVRKLEASRINVDKAFQGPRPSWAE